MTTSIPQQLGRGRLALFSLLFAVSAGVGAAGAVGTFTNARAVFHSNGSALGLVAAGEGAVLVIGLVMTGFAVILLPRPAWMRYLVLGVPLAASTAGAAIAPDLSRAVLYAVTPLGMTVAAELAGMLAHAIVVYRTGVDVEALARTSATTRRLAYLRSAAANHPDEQARRRAEMKAWKVAKRLGGDDATLGGDLAQVQRDRLVVAADDAIGVMFAIRPAHAAITSESRREIPLPARGDDDGGREIPLGDNAAHAVVAAAPARDGDTEGADGEGEPSYREAMGYAANLLAHEPPTWDSLTLREAVAKADGLMPGLSSPMLSAALREVGIDVSAASIRSTRSALRRIGKTDA